MTDFHWLLSSGFTFVRILPRTLRERRACAFIISVIEIRHVFFFCRFSTKALAIWSKRLTITVTVRVASLP